MYLNFRETDLQELLLERAIPKAFASSGGADMEGFTLRHSLFELEFQGMCLDSFHLGYSRWQQNQTMRIRLLTDSPYLEMHFNLTGNHSAIIKGAHKPITFHSKEHNLFYLPAYNGVVETSTQRSVARSFRVKFTEAYFINLASGNEPLLLPLLEAVAKKDLRLLGECNREITPRMEIIIGEIIGCKKGGVLRRLFIESKVLELLMLQLEQFAPAPSSGRTSPGKDDLERLHQAKLLIEQNLGDPYSLKELARQVGLNEFKLKKGFREVVGNSVFGYLHELRMQEARRLMADRRQSIREIAEYCGYQYPQHFSTAFKKRYGVSPGKFMDPGE